VPELTFAPEKKAEAKYMNTNNTNPGGAFTLPGTSITLNRLGYGAMQLAGEGVWGPPRDPDAAVAVLREAVALGVNHIDTAASTARTPPIRLYERPFIPIQRAW
jgi:hypothetical protein